MSLGLVAYDDSDDSDNERDIEADSKSNIGSSSNTNVSSSPYDTKPVEKDPSIERKKVETTVISDEETEITGDSKILPKLHIPESRIKLLNTDIDVKCLTSANKKNGPVKITIPSLNEIDVESEEPSKKKLKPSKKGSGLFALLPDPKSKLVPQSVVSRKKYLPNNKETTARKVSKPVVKAQTKSTPLTSYEDSGDEEGSSGTDFFSLDSKDEDLIPAPVDVDVSITTTEVCQPEPVPPKVNDDALQFSDSFQPSPWQVSSSALLSHSATQQPTSEYPTEEFMTCSTADLELDQEAMQQLCGRRDRLKMQEVNLIDVSGDAIMPDSREWLTKQMTEEQTHRPSHKKRDGPTSQQKRKHQITYLAYQAKENELELKNQWANNRMSRKQTQAKYGF